MNTDPIPIINFLLCVLILIMGIVENTRSKTHLPLYVGLAFGLFGLSHLMTILNLAVALSLMIIVMRLVAYILIIYSLYLLIVKNKSKL